MQRTPSAHIPIKCLLRSLSSPCSLRVLRSEITSGGKQRGLCALPVRKSTLDSHIILAATLAWEHRAKQRVVASVLSRLVYLKSWKRTLVRENNFSATVHSSGKLPIPLSMRSEENRAGDSCDLHSTNSTNSSRELYSRDVNNFPSNRTVLMR